jgi:hypothetical protein
MAATQKPLSFSLCPENIEYVLDVVAKQKLTNRRYNRSTYMDDLITHLRTKSEAQVKNIQATGLAVADKGKVPSKRFIPPTPLEVDAYFVERGINDPNEAQSFCDFYESNGWKVGKNKMKSWKASVRNWLKGYKAKTGNTNILQDSSNSDWHLKEDTGF